VTNYLRGKNPENWRTNIPDYRRVKEHDAYPGIDLAFTAHKDNSNTIS
jgi:hypothetical protein